KDGEYLQISRVFECGKCESCIVKEKCTTSKGQRKIRINEVLNELQNTVDINLGTEEGKEMKVQRSIQAEGTFGVIKQDMNYIRLRRRGSVNVRTELFLIGIAFNIRKYHNRKIRKQKQVIS
ncbi:MAG: transposase, partial [Bacilli bacterium]